MHNPNGSFRKVFAAGLAITTALWTVSAFAVIPFASAQVEVHPAGTLVLSGGTVWKISDDGSQRMGFDSAEKFWSHRYEFSDVVPANSADLALPDGGLVGWGSGVLFNDNGTVYQVSGGQKFGFTSAAVFTGLGFDFANVVNGNLSGLASGGNIDNTTGAHKEGTLVNDNGTVWYITATGRSGFTQPGELFSLGAGFDEVVPANAADLALANEGTMGFRTGTLVNDNGTIWAVEGSTKRGFPTASCYTGFGFTFAMPVAGSTSALSQGTDFCPGSGAPTPGPSVGTLTVSLASDTPASQTVVKNAARVGFVKVNFTATGGDVVIDSMEVERTGIALDSNFTDIILLDVSGGTSVAQAAQIGNEKSLGSTHKATFNDDITVSNGTTKSILVAANMNSTVQNGDKPKLQVNSVAVSGSASVVGSLPVVGNEMTMNNNVVITTATIAAGGQNPSASTQNVGTNDYVVSSIKITNGSQEKMEVHSIKFTQNGSAGDSDVSNLELVLDGSVIGTVSEPDDKVVSFVLSSPVIIDKGANKEFALRLDIVDGSSRAISFDIDKKADVVVKGQTFGFFIVPSYPNSSAPFFNANDTTIDKGTITFSKGVVSSLNVAEGSNSQVLGAFKSTVQGEAVRVTQFVVGVTVSGAATTSDVTNLVVKDSNGNIVAGPVDPSNSTNGNSGSATSTDTIIFPVGTNTYTVEGDLNSDFTAGDTVLLKLISPNNQVTAKGDVTNQTITPTPTSDLSLDTVTVQAAALKVSTSASPAAQSVIIGASGFVFANYVLDASSSGEDVRVTQLAIRHETDADTSREDHIANLKLFNGSTALSPIVQPSNSASATNATSTFSLTNPVVVPKGGSVTLTLKGDVVGGAASDTHQFGCVGSACVTAVGASTANSITVSVTNSDGQVMTFASSGSLTVATGADNPDADQLVGGASQATVGELLLSALDEDVDLTSIHFTTTAVNVGALNDEFSRVYLFDGSTQIASVVPTTTAVTFENLGGSFVIPKGSGGKKLTLKVDTFNVTNTQGDGNVADAGDGVSFAVAQDAYNAKGVASGSSIGAGSKSGTFTGNQFTVYKSVPTFEKLSLSSNTLINASGQPLFKFKLSADAKGDVGFYQASFLVTTTTATVTNFELFEEPGTGNEKNLTNNAARSISRIITDGGGAAGGVYTVDILFDTGTDGVGSGGEFRFIPAGSSKTFELRATIANSVTGSTVVTNLLGDTTFSDVTYPDKASTSDTHADFIWSDLHMGNSSTTATGANEWFNGFRVKGMTSTSTGENLTK